MRFYAHAVPESRQQEIELLLCCSRTVPDPQTQERIRALIQKGVDWEYLISAALRHRVLGLLYRTLKNMYPPAVPDDVWEKLRTYFFTNAAHCITCSDKLLEILNLFKDHDILAIPFKGPALAKSSYGDLALRHFGDLDILVHQDEAFRACCLIISLGYRPQVELNREQFKVYTKNEYSIEMEARNGSLPVDLHWEMTGRYTAFPFGLELFKDRLESTTLDGVKIDQLPGEDLLVYQCLHGTKHCWEHLESVCTVAELLRSRPDMDWMQIDRLARKIRCERILSLALFMAHDLLGAPLPDPAFKMVKSNSVMEDLALKVYRGLFHESNGMSWKFVSSDFSSFHMKVRDRFSDKIRYGASLVFRPSRQEWKYFSLPAPTAFLHYLLRPARLTTAFAAALLRKHLKKSDRITIVTKGALHNKAGSSTRRPDKSASGG